MFQTLLKILIKCLYRTGKTVLVDAEVDMADTKMRHPLPGGSQQVQTDSGTILGFPRLCRVS